MRSRLLLAMLGILLAASVIACDEDEGAGADPNVDPTPWAPGVYSPQGERRIEEIIIMDDGVDPDQVEITTGAAAQFRVANRSDTPCTFFVGDIIIGRDVPPGETVTIGLTVPRDRSGETVEMGCEGDPERQGSAVVEFRGVLPGAGR